MSECELFKFAKGEMIIPETYAIYDGSSFDKPAVFFSPEKRAEGIEGLVDHDDLVEEGEKMSIEQRRLVWNTKTSSAVMVEFSTHARPITTVGSYGEGDDRKYLKEFVYPWYDSRDFRVEKIYDTHGWFSPGDLIDIEEDLIFDRTAYDTEEEELSALLFLASMMANSSESKMAKVMAFQTDLMGKMAVTLAQQL
jgi:hypothetical protein